MTFLSGTMKIRIVLCLPCVFTARANWHGAGVLSRAPSLPWWQWQPATAWRVKNYKYILASRGDARKTWDKTRPDRSNGRVKKDVFLAGAAARHFEPLGNQPLYECPEHRVLSAALNGACYLVGEKKRGSLRTRKLVSSKGMNYPRTNKG